MLGVGTDRRDELWATSVPGGAAAVAAKAVRWHRHGRLWWYRWRFIAEVGGSVGKLTGTWRVENVNRGLLPVGAVPADPEARS